MSRCEGAEEVSEKEVEAFSRAQQRHAISSLERALRALAEATDEDRAELAAIGFGRLQAFWTLGIVSDEQFDAFRRFFGY